MKNKKKTLASLLAAGDQIVSKKTAEFEAAILVEWKNLLEACAAELGDELAAKIGDKPQKSFRAFHGEAVYLLQVRPFDAGSILIAFRRDAEGNWALADGPAFCVCTEYLWNPQRKAPKSIGRIPVDNLPEAVSLCDTQTEIFKAIKEQAGAAA